MTDENDDIEQTQYWAERAKRQQGRHMELCGFVYNYTKKGLISQEASDAFNLAGIKVMQDAGIIEPQWSGQYVGDSLITTVSSHADHASIKALLIFHPELKDELERRFPPLDQGPAR